MVRRIIHANNGLCVQNKNCNYATDDDAMCARARARKKCQKFDTRYA